MCQHHQILPYSLTRYSQSRCWQFLLPLPVCSKGQRIQGTMLWTLNRQYYTPNKRNKIRNLQKQASLLGKKICLHPQFWGLFAILYTEIYLEDFQMYKFIFTEGSSICHCLRSACFQKGIWLNRQQKKHINLRDDQTAIGQSDYEPRLLSEKTQEKENCCFCYFFQKTPSSCVPRLNYLCIVSFENHEKCNLFDIVYLIADDFTEGLILLFESN